MTGKEVEEREIKGRDSIGQDQDFGRRKLRQMGGGKGGPKEEISAGAGSNSRNSAGRKEEATKRVEERRPFAMIAWDSTRDRWGSPKGRERGKHIRQGIP